MSDHIAHIGICDDTFRLARLHPQVHRHFKALFDSQREDAHLGCITRYADKWTADVVAWAAGEHAKTASERDANVDRKLAFVLGSLTHRAADRLTKPITNCWKGEPDSGAYGSAANESKIMQDIFVWREVFGQGQGELAWAFTPDVLGLLPTKAGQDAEAMFRLLLRRAMISMHTINPDAGHIHPWLDALFKGLQTFPKSLEQYGRLAAEWPADKVRKYLTDKRFYQHEDPIIQLARAMQRDQTVTPDAVVSAVASTGKAQSRYGRALAKAIEYLIAATELFDGRVGIEEAKTRFDVGVPELSIQE